MDFTKEYVKKLEEENQSLKQFIDTYDKDILKKMFESNQIIMLMLHMHTGQILDANEAAVLFYKYPKEKLLKLRIEDLNTTSPANLQTEEIRKLNKNHNNYVFSHQLADGTIKKVEIYSSPSNIGDQTVLFSSIYDVTKQVDTEGGLHKNGEKFASAFRSNPNSMIISDLLIGEIYDVNDAFFELTGLKRNDIIGKTTLSIDLYVNPQDREKMTQTLKKKGSVRNMKIKMRHRSGKILTVLASGELLKTSHEKTIIITLLDITQREQLRDELESNNELLQAIFNSVPAMITIYNPNLQQIETNKEFERITGWTEEDIKKSNILNLVYPDPEYREMAAMYMQSLQPGFKDFIMTGKDGSRIETIWANVKLADGRQVGIGIDNRERRKAQEELERSQGIIKAALASMTDAILIFSPEGRLLYLNDTFVTFHRFKSKEECPELLDEYKNFLDLFFIDETPAPIEMWPVSRALNGEMETNAEYILQRKDTKEKWIGNYSFAPIIEKDGRITGAVAIARDITNRKNNEKEREQLLEQLAYDKQALAESEQRYRIMGESIDYGVWATDAEGKATHISESFCQLVGKTFEEIQELGWLDILIPEQQKEVKDLWMKSVKTGKRFEHEHKFITKSGEIKTVLAIGKPIRNPNNEIVSWAGINLDITERKKIEQKLEEKNGQLTQMNDILEDFVKIAAHDLRSPIQNLISINELVNQSSAEEKLTLISLLDPITKQLQYTVDGLMKTVSLQTQQKLAVAKLRFTKVWKEVSEELSSQMIKFQGRIETNFKNAPDIHFIEVQLISIIRNLVSNAIKYSSKNENAYIKISTSKENKFILFKIEDNGIGINLESTGTDLFKPFKRFTSKAEGTGMGLYIVKNMVERNGGYIRVESKPNIGTTFYCYLKEYIMD